MADFEKLEYIIACTTALSELTDSFNKYVTVVKTNWSHYPKIGMHIINHCCMIKEQIKFINDYLIDDVLAKTKEEILDDALRSL